MAHMPPHEPPRSIASFAHDLGTLAELFCAYPLKNLTIDDLCVFCDVYSAIRGGGKIGDALKRQNVPQKRWTRILTAVERSLAPGMCLHKFRDDPGEMKSAGAVFHDGIGQMLRHLVDTLQRCQKSRSRVAIQGTGFTIQYLLPEVLKKSDLLEKARDIDLDIKEGNWREIIHNLSEGIIDLGLGPSVLQRPSYIERELILKIRRAIVCHKDHEFACKKNASDVLLKDLAEETVFVLSWNAVPTFNMEQYLPAPKGRGRRVYVDEISHMYAYVRRNLGVALGYKLPLGTEASATLCTKGVEEDTLPAVAIYLYYVASAHIGTPSPFVETVRRTIERHAHEMSRDSFDFDIAL